MARIAGVNVPTNKRVHVALTYVHGIGLTSSKNICKKIGIPENKIFKISGEVFNIACGGRISLLELWDAIASATGSKQKPIFTDPRQGDMPHSQASIHKAQTMLGYTPVTNFDTGIRKTVAWYQSQGEKS